MSPATNHESIVPNSNFVVQLTFARSWISKVTMVQYRFILLLCMLKVAEAGTVEDLFNVFFRPLWNLLVQGICNSIAPNFDDGFRLGCKCRGIYNSGAALEGLGGEFTCKNDAKYCVIQGPVPLYCGTVDLKVAFNARKGPTNIDACFNVKSGLPEGISGGEFPRVCAKVVPNGPDFTFKSCEIKFGDKKCESCTICANKRDFLFNCSSINVNPAGTPFVEGPALTQCEGFGFLDDI
jgi:hypothetical protein